MLMHEMRPENQAEDLLRYPISSSCCMDIITLIAFFRISRHLFSSFRGLILEINIVKKSTQESNLWSTSTSGSIFSDWAFKSASPSLSLLCFWILILCICVSRNVSINASPTFKKFQRRLFLYESNLCGFFDFSDT